MNKSEIFIEDIEEEATIEDYQQVASSSSSSFSSPSRAAITLVCVYDDVIKNPKDQIKWYFNKHRIRSSLDDPHGNQIKIMSRNPLVEGDGSDVSAGAGQFSSSFSPNHHFTITQSLSEDKNTTISSLIIHNFNLKYNYGRYRCQYKGLVKTVKIYPNHKNGKNMLFF